MRLCQHRKPALGHSPAAMADIAAEWRLADHVPCQPDCRCVETVCERHAAAFGLFAYRANREMLAQRRAATVVHEPRGGADVGIGITCNVLFDKVNEACTTLEKSQKLKRRLRACFLDRGCGRGCGGCRGLGRRDGFHHCPVAQPTHLDGEFAVTQDGEKGSDGQRKSAEKRHVRFGHTKLLLWARVNNELSWRPRDKAR